MTLSQWDYEHVGTIVRGHGDWFTAELLRLIAKADLGNRERLRGAFPAEVNAYERWLLTQHNRAGE